MSGDPIQDLLRKADELAGPGPDGTGDLALRARTAVRRRKIARGAVGGALLVAAVGVAAFYTASRTPQSAPLVAVTDKPPAPDPGRFRAEIRWRRATVARMLELEEARRLNAIIANMPDPAANIRKQVERAAYTLMQLADRQENRNANRKAAAETYRQVVTHFPRTHWAQVARDRLAELSKTTGDTL